MSMVADAPAYSYLFCMVDSYYVDYMTFEVDGIDFMNAEVRNSAFCRFFNFLGLLFLYSIIEFVSAKHNGFGTISCCCSAAKYFLCSLYMGKYTD